MTNVPPIPPQPGMPPQPAAPQPGMPPQPMAPQPPGGMAPQPPSGASQTLDWNQLYNDSGGAFVPLAPGTYDVAVKTAQATTTSNNKVNIKVQFQVLSGPYAGKTVWNNFIVSPENPNALKYFFTHMAAMGLDQNFFAQNPAPSVIADTLVGRQCVIDVTNEYRAGAERDNVANVKPPGSNASAVPMATPAPQGAPPMPQAAPQAPTPPPAPQPAPPQPMAPIEGPAPDPAAQVPGFVQQEVQQSEAPTPAPPQPQPQPEPEPEQAAPPAAPATGTPPPPPYQ